MSSIAHDRPIDLAVGIEWEDVFIEADWTVPLRPRGTVLILNGAGNSRFARHNREVSHYLYDEGFATLIVDLFTPVEEREDALTGALRLDVDLMASRVVACTKWIREETEVAHLPIGYLASGIASAAALVAASRNPSNVSAVVSRGGRPDLAGVRLHKVEAATLLIVGSLDIPGIELNRWTLRRVNCEKRLVTIPDAAHALVKPCSREAVCQLAGSWFTRMMPPPGPQRSGRSIFSINMTDAHMGGVA